MADVDTAGLREQLAPLIAEGRLVLFTGAGFSVDARNRHGDPLPSTAQLADLLRPIALGEDAERDPSELGDLWDCAIADEPERATQLLREQLRVDDSSLGDAYRTWFSMPWRRAYTLNIDDLDEAAARRWQLPAPILPISALRDPLPARVDGLLSIHLNGRVCDAPDVTFSWAQYGRRTAVPDPWYQHLAVDLRDEPVVLVGTTLAEPPLWQQLAVHLGDDRARRDRPRSWLVTPSFPAAKRRVLCDLNVEWVPMHQHDFANEVLAPLDSEGVSAEGHRRLAGAPAEG